MDDEIREILVEILTMLRELKEEIQLLKVSRRHDFGELISGIIKSVSKIIEDEVNRAITMVRKTADGRVIFYPFRKGKHFFYLENILPFSKKGKIEREIDETLKEIELETKSGKTNRVDYEPDKIDLFRELIVKLNPSEVAETLSVLSNPDRLTILKLLYKQDRYFSELEDILEIGPSSLRHHLSRLINAGLVKQERSRGKYAITRRGIAALILSSYLHKRILRFGEDLDGDDYD